VPPPRKVPPWGIAPTLPPLSGPWSYKVIFSENQTYIIKILGHENGPTYDTTGVTNDGRLTLVVNCQIRAVGSTINKRAWTIKISNSFLNTTDMTSHSWCLIVALTNQFCQIYNKDFQATKNCICNFFALGEGSSKKTIKFSPIVLPSTVDISETQQVALCRKCRQIRQRLPRDTSDWLRKLYRWLQLQKPWPRFRSESEDLCIWTFFRIFWKRSAKAWSPASNLKFSMWNAGTNLVTS